MVNNTRARSRRYLKDDKKRGPGKMIALIRFVPLAQRALVVINYNNGAAYLIGIVQEKSKHV
jgi:hypothetical protein